MKVLGIDPGRHGAIALLSDDALQVWDIPDTLPALHAMLFSMLPVKLCALEQIYAGPQMGRRAIGVMFEGYGALKMSLSVCGIPNIPVRPSVWKKMLNIPADKTAARRRASEFFPDHDHLWPLKKHDGRAEAALIAWWAKGQAK